MQVFGMSSHNPHEGQGEITLREARVKGEFEDGGLIIVFRRLLMISESITELYRDTL